MPNVWSTAAALSQIAYSDKESLDVIAGTSQASVRLMCAWADRYTILGDILGNLKVWPLNPLSTALASKASIIGVPQTKYTNTDGEIIYQDAFLDIQYSNFDPEVTSGAEESTDNPTLRFVDTVEPTVEFLTLDHKQFQWTNADGPDVKKDEAPGRQVRGLTLSRTIYGFTTLPASILTLPGKVNDTAFTSTALGLTFAIGTLLFTPPSITVSVKTDGSKERTATLKLLYKEETWNKFWRAESQSYEEIWDREYNNGAGRVYKNYPEADMSDWLFN